MNEAKVQAFVDAWIEEDESNPIHGRRRMGFQYWCQHPERSFASLVEIGILSVEADYRCRGCMIGLSASINFDPGTGILRVDNSILTGEEEQKRAGQLLLEKSKSPSAPLPVIRSDWKIEL